MNLHVSRQIPTANIAIANRSWRGKTVGGFRTDEHLGETKEGLVYGDKDRTKMKRRFRNSVIRSGRADHVSVPVALTQLPAAPPIFFPDSSSTNRDCQSLRNYRCNHGSHRHVSQASKRRDEQKHKDRKQSVIGSLASILGPEEDLSLEPTNGLHLTSGKHSTDTVTTDDDEIQKRRSLLLVSRASSISRASSNQGVINNKKDRKQCVIGSLASILGPEDGTLSAFDNKAFTDSRKKSPTKLIEAAIDEGSPLTVRKRRLSSKRRDLNMIDRKVCISGSFTSILGPQEESLATTHNSVHSTSGTNLRDSNITGAGTRSGTSFPATRRRRTNQIGSIPVSMKPDAEKTRKIQFDETKARELIRAKLRKNQQKYSTLAAALASTKDKTASAKIPSALTPPTPAPESTKPFVPNLQFIPISTTMSSFQQPKLRSRARNGRLYSVCKRIPASIPEDGVLEMNTNPPDTKRRSSKAPSKGNVSSYPWRTRKEKASSCPKSPKKAKASFQSRSPKNSPTTLTRKQRRFRVVTPHPIESAGSSKGNYGGLCMTFPSKDNGTKAKEAKSDEQKNNFLIFDQWLASQQ